MSPHDESEEFVDPWTTGSGFASTSAPQDSPSTPATSFHEPSPFLHSLQYTSYEGRPAPSPHSPADYRFPPPADPAPEGYSSVMPPRRPRSPPPPKREEPGEPCVAKDASRKGKGAVEWLELDEADRAELTEKGSAAYKKAHGKVKVPRVTKKAKLEAARLLREGSRSGGTVKERKTGPKKANDLDHVPRPPNAWILYRSEQIRVLKQDQETSRKPQSEICASFSRSCEVCRSLNPFPLRSQAYRLHVAGGVSRSQEGVRRRGQASEGAACLQVPKSVARDPPLPTPADPGPSLTRLPLPSHSQGISRARKIRPSPSSLPLISALLYPRTRTTTFLAPERFRPVHRTASFRT